MAEKQKGICKIYEATRRFFCIGLFEDDERKAIEEHKYYMSQNAGYDVGWELACADWKKNYSRKWRQEKQK
jgi:hypothetical protein